MTVWQIVGAIIGLGAVAAMLAVISFGFRSGPPRPTGPEGGKPDSGCYLVISRVDDGWVVRASPRERDGYWPPPFRYADPDMLMEAVERWAARDCDSVAASMARWDDVGKAISRSF